MPISLFYVNEVSLLQVFTFNLLQNWNQEEIEKLTKN